MSPAHTLRFAFVALCVLLASGCSGHGSSVPLDALGHAVRLRSYSEAARTGSLEGPSSSASFGFNPETARLSGRSAATVPLALEVVIKPIDTIATYSVGLSFLTAEDFGPDGNPVSATARGAQAVVTDIHGDSGEIRLGMVIPKGSVVRGFTVSFSGSEGSRASVVSASMVPAETGWRRGAGFFRACFSPDGGQVSPESAGRALWRMPEGSSATVYLSANPDGIGTPKEQDRVAFSQGSFTFGFRKAPNPASPCVPSFILSDGPSSIRAVDGAENIDGLAVEWERAYRTPDAASPLSPILADPGMIIEWPRASWRRVDREVFAWDRFPSVLIFDTADYATQDRYFKRLAFFVEKKGWRGKLWTDAETAGEHAYYAHDYRAESLAEFFTRAADEKFPLGTEELELRDILLAEGVIAKKGRGFAPGAGAIVSISRESVSYLRYLFMAHECYHGIYFVDPGFRAKMTEVYRSMDPRAIEFLKSYFTIIESLGYDTSDEYLMENEFMAYLMQQPLDRVGQYFAGNIAERFRKHGGDPELDRWVVSTEAAEFARAASELNAYAFGRWGLAGGRVGLFWSEK